MKILKLITITICCLFVSGCTRFIVPEIGSTTQEESRIPYKGIEKQDGVLETKDLYLEYTLSANDSGTYLTGELVFDRSLTDSFPVVKTFFLKMSWLDADGSVLKTIDVTPLYGYRSSNPGKLKITKKIDTVPGGSFISFNYYGVFRGEKPDVSEEWDIVLFPFTAP